MSDKSCKFSWYFCLNIISKSATVTKLPSFLTVRKRSCLHPPAKKTRAISGRTRICLAKWSVWRGWPPGTKRRPHGILLWWAHGLSSFAALCFISANEQGPPLLVLCHTCSIVPFHLRLLVSALAGLCHWLHPPLVGWSLTNFLEQRPGLCCLMNLRKQTARLFFWRINIWLILHLCNKAAQTLVGCF